jgi:hypothetical protein
MSVSTLPHITRTGESWPVFRDYLVNERDRHPEGCSGHVWLWGCYGCPQVRGCPSCGRLLPDCPDPSGHYRSWRSGEASLLCGPAAPVDVTKETEWLLRELGDTADEVAARLAGWGITGIRRSAGQSPTMELLALLGVPVEKLDLDARHIGFEMVVRPDGIGCDRDPAALPEAVAEFEERFDRGCYPALDRDAIRLAVAA